MRIFDRPGRRKNSCLPRKKIKGADGKEAQRQTNAEKRLEKRQNAHALFMQRSVAHPQTDARRRNGGYHRPGSLKKG